MERKVGSVFFCKDRKFRVVKGLYNSCKGCCFVQFYENGDSECHKPANAGWCLAADRQDGIDVIFKKV